VNRVRPGVNRVSADEMSYHLHILLRYELELALLAGSTDEAIDGIWAKPKEFGRYALPTLTKKAIRHALSALNS